MIKLDRNKFTGTNHCMLTLRPNFGRDRPIKVNFITSIYVNEEDYITSVDYRHPATFMSHYCYGHQIDNIEYL